MTAEGIIFDFNGTMLYDGELQEESWKIFLESKIGRSVSDEEFQEYVHGRNVEITLSYFLKSDLTKEQIKELEEKKEVVYRQLCMEQPEQFRLAAGLPEFLDALRQREIPFTIATASGLNNVKFFFQHLGLGRWFNIDNVVYNDGTIPGKPEPEIYLKAAKVMGVHMEKCIVFEDARAGIEAAKRAGAAKIIGVSSMLDEDMLLTLPGVTAVIRDYRNIMNLLPFCTSL